MIGLISYMCNKHACAYYLSAKIEITRIVWIVPASVSMYFFVSPFGVRIIRSRLYLIHYFE